MKIGTTTLGQSGIGLTALAVIDASTRFKPGGITIDWDKVNPLKAGRNQKYTLNTEVATDGTFTVTVGANTTSALDHDVSVANLEVAIEGLASVGAGNVLVTGTPAVYTIEFVEDLREQPVTLTVNGASLVATNTHVLTETQVGVTEGEATLLDGTVVKTGDKYIELGTVMAKITATGKYAPADTTAGDGRETVTSAVRGDRFILNRPVIQSIHGEHVGDVFDGGVVFKSRLQMDSAYTGAPTEANVEAMFPAVTFHTD